jgi:hypothetical protein
LFVDFRDHSPLFLELRKTVGVWGKEENNLLKSSDVFILLAYYVNENS